MSAEDDGPGTREVAHRVFAAEFDDSDLSYSESDEERAPNYVVTPSGARINRLFLVGVLTEKEWVNDDMLRARVVDPTGAFVVYAGQYQPDELAFLERVEPPTFLAVTGKARTFQPEDSDRVFTSVRPESVSEVDADTRDRWVVEAAKRTIERVETAATAIETGHAGEDLTAALEANGVEPALASGIALALDHYGTTPAYLSALRTLAEEALEMVAGDRDTVGRLELAPDEGDGDAGALAAAPASETEGSTASDFEPVTEGTMASEADTDQSTTDATSPSEPTGTDTPETASPSENMEPAEMDEDSETDDIGDFEPDDDLGDFDPEEDDVLTDEEREQIESEYGTDFSTGDEVESEPALGSDNDAVEAPDAEDETDTEADSEPASETQTVGSDGEDASDEPEPTDEDVSIDEAVMDAMADLDDGAGADHEELVETVVERTGTDADTVEEAIQDALMSGRCYEPDDGVLKPI